MNRQRNKFHCDLPHPNKSEWDAMRSNCTPVKPPVDQRSKQIEQDMTLAFIKIVDTANRLIIESATQPSLLVTDSHASKEVDEKDLG